jgi:hypothetical protein
LRPIRAARCLPPGTSHTDGGLADLFQSIYSQNDPSIPKGGFLAQVAGWQRDYAKNVLGPYKLRLIAYEGGQGFASGATDALDHLCVAANWMPAWPMTMRAISNSGSRWVATLRVLHRRRSSRTLRLVGRDSVTHADVGCAEHRAAEVASHSEIHFEHALLADELRLAGATIEEHYASAETCDAIRGATRSALAAMVRLGLTAPLRGMKDASTT